ncbi:Riboflavin transporter MCH5 [Smittium culicis]|uniref:Riboflavin transporter MCH5 n=1 Tax=Smittium culicis TaxID=133412 RepID=A0A1R1WZL7_9FUNG|nr:Riboflavin transporter MCH5 [Smittium culicis]
MSLKLKNEMNTEEIRNSSESKHRDITTDQFPEIADKNENDDENIPPPDSLQAWIIVGFATLAYGNVFGNLTVSGILQEYYLNTMFPNEPAAVISWISTISFTLGYMGGLLAGPMVSFIGIKYVTLIGALTSTLGLALAALSNTIWQLVLTQGVIYGFGSSLLINLSLTMASLWLVKHKSLGLGIVSSGSGFGGLILAPTMRKTLPVLGIHWTFGVLAIINFVPAMFCVFLFKKRGEFNPPRTLISFSLFKRPFTLFVCICAFLNQFGTSLIVLYFPATITDIGQSRSTASNTVLIYSALGGVGRIVANIMSKKWGNNNTLIFSAFGSAALIFGLWLPTRLFSVYLVFISFFGLLYPMAFPLMAALVSNNYKKDEILQANGLMFFAYGLSTLAGVPVMGLLFDKLGHRTSYVPVIISGGIVYFVNGVLFVLFRLYVRRYEPNAKIGKL